MEPFKYARADDPDNAAEMARPQAGSGGARYIAGGTNMTDYMRLNVLRPKLVIDISNFPQKAYGQIEADQSGLRFGCLVRMSEAEDHAVVRRDYPVIYDALRLAASRQIRNMATLGGNVLQRTRCEYFRETSWACNKREPGAGCAALEGINRQHAVLGVSPNCIAAYAGDFGQALIALDASVDVTGPGGERSIRFADLHRLPADTPHVETTLDPSEVIASLSVPAGPWTRRSLYLKIRDRESYQFALTSAAVALDLDGDKVRTARIALGGVSSVPWRAREAEEALEGKILDEDSASRAAEVAFSTAEPRRHNAFKIPVGKNTLVRALLQAKAMEA